MTEFYFLDRASTQGTMYPFTLMRDRPDLPLGLLTLRQKWTLLFNAIRSKSSSHNITLASDLFPGEALAKSIFSLSSGQSLFDVDGHWMATAEVLGQPPKKALKTDRIWSGESIRLIYPWDLLPVLPRAIEMDFRSLTKGKRSLQLPKQARHSGKYPVFIEKGARIAASFFNTEQGPIYIGASAVIQEGAMIHGPFLLGQHSVIKMGASIYGPVAVGMRCLIGGEVKRSMVFPFSNKAHHGYLGDSVIGSWCNWGAGTSNSNVKNTGGEIRMDVGGDQVLAGKKLGVFMGDHSRTAINSSLNSGSLIGVSVQVGTGALAQKKISSFRWMDGKRYRFQEALEHIRNWKSFKEQKLTEDEIDRLKAIYKNDK